MSLPKVSCLCPTFGRVHLLEEAVESFLRQDYQGEKELVICNDFDQQHLEFDHPEVKVVNCKTRTETLGAKRNLTASHATGEFFLTWGDDDIHLQSRISRMVQEVMLKGLPFCLEGFHFVYDKGSVRRNDYSTAGAHIIHRSTYWSAGGVPEKDSGEDVAFNDKLKVLLRMPTFPVCKSDPQFIYRWASPRPHISALAQHPNGVSRCYAEFYNRASSSVSSGDEPSGNVQLSPRWLQPWEDMALCAS